VNHAVAGGLSCAAHGDFSACLATFVEDVAKFRAADSLTPIVALVGSHVARGQLRRDLHARCGGVFGVSLLTFGDLARALGRPALAADRLAPAPGLYQQALMARLLAERAKYFAPVAGYDGAAAAFLETFERLEQAGWERYPSRAPRVGKIGEVAGLYDAYRDELGERFFTAQDELAAATAAAGDFATRFGTDRLHVVGLYDANARQRELLTALAGRVEVRCYTPDVLDPPPLAKAAGGQAAQPWRAEESRFEVWSCPSEVAETEAIARRIRGLAAEGVPLDEIAVLIRRPGDYADLLVDALGRAGVPFQLDDAFAPLAGPTLRALLRLAGLIDTPLGRAETIGFLSVVPLPSRGEAQQHWRETQRNWDRVSRLARVKSGDDWDHRLNREVSGAEADWANPAANDLREAALALRAGLARLAGAATYAQAAAALADTARDFVAADEDLRRALEGIAAIGVADEAGLAFNLPRFVGWVGAAIRQAAVAPLPKGGVRIADWISGRGVRARFVFAPGCVEGAVPSPQRQDPILLDRQREQIMYAVGAPGVLPLAAEMAREELRLFQITLRAASEKIVLCYPRLESGEGRTRLPSHLVLDLVGALAGRALAIDELIGEPVVRFFAAGRFAPESAAEALDRAERDLFALNELTDETARVHYLLQARPETFGPLWRRQRDRYATPERVTESEGVLTDPAALALVRQWLADKDYWSVSDVEKFVLCPRRFLYGRVLKLDAPDDPEAVVAAPSAERGSAFHDIMEEATQDAAASVRDLVATAYDGLVRKNLTGGGALDNAEKERLGQDVEAMMAFARRHSEAYTLKNAEEEIAIGLPLAGGETLRVKGRLDRLDQKPDGGLRIVDYKSGKAKDRLTGNAQKKDKLNAGTALQVPLYAFAYAEQTGIAGPIEAAYWYVNRDKDVVKPKALTFTAEAIAAHGATIKTMLAQIIDSVKAGLFAPRHDVADDSENNYCGNCDFTVICDGRSRAIMASKRLDKTKPPLLVSLHPWYAPLAAADGEDNG
jgi:ATP-dependent helicase/nuclease subunit B